MGLIFIEIYSWSISDSDIIEKSDLINWVEEEHVIMSDKGFPMQDLSKVFT